MCDDASIDAHAMRGDWQKKAAEGADVPSADDIETPQTLEGGDDWGVNVEFVPHNID